MKKQADKIRRIGLIGNLEKADCGPIVRQAARLIKRSGRTVFCDVETARLATFAQHREPSALRTSKAPPVFVDAVVTFVPKAIPLPSGPAILAVTTMAKPTGDADAVTIASGSPLIRLTKAAVIVAVVSPACVVYVYGRSPMVIVPASPTWVAVVVTPLVVVLAGGSLTAITPDAKLDAWYTCPTRGSVPEAAKIPGEPVPKSGTPIASVTVTLPSACWVRT